MQAFSDYNLCSRLNALNPPKRALPKYDYPDELMTVSHFSSLLNRGIEFSIHKSECVFIEALDEQKPHGKKLFGCGLLMEKEKNCVKFALSERERAIVEDLNTHQQIDLISERLEAYKSAKPLR